MAEKKKKNNVIFWGSSPIAVPILQALSSSSYAPALVVSQQDTVSSKGRTPTPVSQWATATKIPLYTPSRPEEVPHHLAERPDVCVLMAYGSIISPELLAWPTLGWINIHPSLLPAYRGASPIQQTILDGVKTTGVSFMLMDEGVDTGPVLCQERETVRADDTATTLGNRISKRAAAMIIPCLEKYVSGSLQPQPQPIASPTPMTRKVQKRHGQVQWTGTAQTIERMTRAYEPWPGVFTFIRGLRLKLTRVRVKKHAHSLSPGIFSIVNDTLLVGTGNGTLEILQLQLEGKKKMTSGEFIRGYPWINQCMADHTD